MIQYNNFIDSPYNDWQEIDIIVSRDCTLRCTYCYLQKNKDSEIKIDEMMESLDIILNTAYNEGKEGVILSYYPEPWVNIERTNLLIIKSLEKLLKYDRFVTNYMIMLNTNGVNLHKPIPIMEQLRDHLSVAVTLDGIKEQHDMYRLFKDGSPSWDIVKNNIIKYQDKYNIRNTKVTLGPETIKYAYESSVFLWDEMGIQDVNMNVVFEDLWDTDYKKQKTIEVFEQQMQLLYDDVIKNKRWEQLQYQSMLGHRNIPHEWLGEETTNLFCQTYCGAASMRSIDSDGGIYPCFRLSPYALNEDNKYNIYRNKEVIRAIKTLNNVDAVVEKCKKCEYLAICPMCVGGAIEEKGSIYWRTTHHCEFVKLQAKYSFELYKKMNEGAIND